MMIVFVPRWGCCRPIAFFGLCRAVQMKTAFSLFVTLNCGRPSVVPLSKLQSASWNIRYVLNSGGATPTSETFHQVPEVVDCLQPIVNIIPLQMLAYHLAIIRGCNVDQPRNLAKSVTVTED